jgi:hypothetical protein
MVWYLKVPKIFHVYWGVGKLPYLRYLTVASFMKYNPEWEVWLWYPKYPSRIVTWGSHELNYRNIWDDWFQKLLKLDIKLMSVDLTEFKQTNEISEVHKSDFLRYYFLSKYGGVYSDMDIVYFKPIINLEINRRKNKNKETFVCISDYGHSNGFFMAAEGSAFFKSMFELAKHVELNKYQSNGPNLCNLNYPTIESIEKISPVEDIRMNAVYYYDAQHINSLYQKTELIFHPNSIGCHWYAGSVLSGIFLNNTNGGLTNLPNNIIGNLCRISL